MVAPEIRLVSADESTIDEPSNEVAVSFWQRPFVQNVVPLCTSLALHAGVVIAGIATYHVVKALRPPTVEQTTVAAMEVMDTGVDQLVPLRRGAVADSSRDVEQDLNIKGLDGLSNAQGRDLSTALAGGTAGVGQGSAELFMGITPNVPGGSTGHVGDGSGSGTGGPGGRLAPFGIPGGGGGGLQFCNSPIAHGTAKRIVFVLDATGSMMPSFDALRVQIRATLQNMRPPQSFNIVFINEQNVPPLAPSLLFVTPENKRRGVDYMEAMAPRGATDPLPALAKAYAMQPELIFLLVDPGDFPDKKAVLDLVSAKGGKVKINVIGFDGHDVENEAYLKALAERTGGRYSHVSREDLMGR